MPRERFLLSAMAMFVWFAMLPTVRAQESPGQEETPPRWQTIRLDELPEPPPELRPVLARGQITFLVGGERPSVLAPSRSTDAQGRVFAAETQFHLSYSFKTHCRWQWADSPAEKRLRIAVRFDQLQLDAQHQIWLRDLPERTPFWDSPLVRHELDHVRLSSDPRLAAQFAKAVSEHDLVELTRQESVPLIALATRRMVDNRPGGRPSGQRDDSILSRLSADDAQPFLDTLVRHEFDRIVQLTQIRYQELDRQTDHGRQSLPAHSPLAEWLQR